MLGTVHRGVGDAEQLAEGRAVGGSVRYAHHAHHHLGMPWAMVAVTGAIYTAARLGLAANLSSDVRTVLGREPADCLAAVAHRERASWLGQGA